MHVSQRLSLGLRHIRVGVYGRHFRIRIRNLDEDVVDMLKILIKVLFAAELGNMRNCNMEKNSLSPGRWGVAVMT